MKNKNDDYDVIFEEIEYLLQNATFQKEVIRIRKKHNITLPDLKKKFPSGSVMMPQLDLIEYGHDTVRLGQRCRLSKSKYRGTFQTILHNYIFTDYIQAMTTHTNLPRIEVLIEDHLAVLKIHLDFDTERGQINKSVKNSWEEIKEVQEKVAGKKLSISKNRNANIKIWKLNMIEGKREEDILKMIDSNEIEDPPIDSDSITGIKDIIERTNSRIQLAIT